MKILPENGGITDDEYITNPEKTEAGSKNFGAQDIYMVGTPEGGEFMIPVVEEFIKNIAEEKGIFVRLIEGMR